MDSSSDFLKDRVDVDLGLLGADVCCEGGSKGGVNGVESCGNICEASSADELRLDDLWRGPLIVDLLRPRSAKPVSSVVGDADFANSVAAFCVS
jgi:hypothetical protein